MKNNKLDKMVLFFIFVTLIVAIFTVYQRINIENQYKSAEIMLEYDEMKKLSDSSDENLEWWLRKFKDFGAYSVAVSEETVNTLVQNGHSIKKDIVAQLVNNYEWEKEFPKNIVNKIQSGSIHKTDCILTIKDESIFNYLLDGLKLRYEDEFFVAYKIGDYYYIVLKGGIDDYYYSSIEKISNIDGVAVSEKREIVDSKLFNIGVGYDEEKINLVKSVGLDVVLRPINYSDDNEKLVDAYRVVNEQYDLVPRIYILYGKEVLGYPDNMGILHEYIKDNDIAPLLIESANQRENLKQEGLNKLVEKVDYNAIRGFTMWDYIRQRNEYYGYSGAEEIENTMFRAITERNIRVIYFKPFFVEEGSRKYLTDIEEYERTFESLSYRLSEHGIELGKANPIKSFHIGVKRVSIMIFGITLAAVYLFKKIFKIVYKYVDILYLGAIVAALIPFVKRDISEKGFALIAAIVFSSLAIYYFMCVIKKVLKSKNSKTNLQIIVQSTLVLTVSIAISLIGAIYVDALLSDVKYLIEMDIFRGVKMAQMIPFLTFIIIYLVYFINDNEQNSIKGIINTSTNILNKEIKIYYLILFGIIAAIGYVYMARTGHETDLQPSTFEMIFRNLLENVLLARPRNKEFLLAFPAIYMAIFAANKKSKFFTFIFMLASAIGTSSVINTFSHLRTPIYLSFVRTVIGLGFGMVLGCILVIVSSFVCKLFAKVQERLQ